MTQKGPLPNWLSPVAHVAAAAYGAAVRARARKFDHTPRRETASIPVVSVGNVTVGGTGKTPFVRWCVQALAEAGHTPMVALRGYRSHGGLSDEALEYAALLPGVPVAVGANRAAGLARVVRDQPAVDCAVLDDAFQHRRLARDLDIVLVDATRPGLDGALLPAGWLREPAAALSRAGLVVVTRATQPDAGVSALVQRYHGRPPAAWCNHQWLALDVFRFSAGGECQRTAEPVSFLHGKGVVAVAALANPAPFVQRLRNEGATIHQEVLRHDHAAYGAAEARQCVALATANEAVVATTWKDWTKLEPALRKMQNHSALTVVVPRITIEFAQGEETVRHALHAAVSSSRR